MILRHALGASFAHSSISISPLDVCKRILPSVGGSVTYSVDIDVLNNLHLLFLLRSGAFALGQDGAMVGQNRTLGVRLGGKYDTPIIHRVQCGIRRSLFMLRAEARTAKTHRLHAVAKRGLYATRFRVNTSKDVGVGRRRNEGMLEDRVIVGN